MAKRRPPAAPRRCDAPGCPETVQRGKLMCRAHWFGTPRHLREAINAAWKERRLRDWSENCLSARQYHAGTDRSAAIAQPPSVSPERSYELQQRLLGERPDA